MIKEVNNGFVNISNQPKKLGKIKGYHKSSENILVFHKNHVLGMPIRVVLDTKEFTLYVHNVDVEFNNSSDIPRLDIRLE